MNKISKIASVVLLFLLIQGCASNLMTTSQTGVIAPPDNDMATVVFMRSSMVAGAIGVELFEIVDGELEFIGALPNGSKVAYKTSPGQKIYMAYGSAADFMIGNIKEGKTYYSIVRPNWGTGGFAPTPIRSDGSTEYNMESSDFIKWKNGTTLLEPKTNANEWFTKNKDKYLKIYNVYWSRFQNKTESEKSERTLLPSDGV
ncbi:MAG: hypothetical protein KBT66_09775 [Amphritea sp.]|nr:hypothetical protein [Amphritea sp.]MBQ0784507.1 hypothetical protein [Amphritea sp.]